MKSPRFAFIVCAALGAVLSARAEDIPVYKNPSAPLERRVETLFEALTPDERLSLVSGAGFSTRAVPRLGIPEMEMVDASQGIRGGRKETQGPATLFGSTVLLAASWDTDLATRVGHGLGVETLNKGIGARVLLGPGVNIIRAPLGGRNGEYLSEDPHVAARLGVAFITGIQSTGVAASVKHYAANSQEFERMSIDARIGERALRELYTPAFIAAVQEGKVWTVMSAYNKINGEYASANWYLQKQILKKEAGYDGIIMTDWGGLHSTLAIDSGCDLAMPGGLNPVDVSRALKDGELSQDNVDDAVRRVIRTIIRVGLLNPSQAKPDPSKVNSPENQSLALETAEKGMVLLKNDRAVLPLDASKIRSIALIGSPAKNWQMGVGGSAGAEPFKSVKPYEAIVERAGAGVSVSYNESPGQRYTGEIVPSSALKPAQGDGQGLTREFFEGVEFTAKPTVTKIDPKIDTDFGKEEADPKAVEKKKFCVRWTGTLTAPATGTYLLNLEFPNQSGARLYIKDQLIQDKWPGFDGSKIVGRVDLVAGEPNPIRIEYVHCDWVADLRLTWLRPDVDLFKNEVESARKADVAIVFVDSGGEGEAGDRITMSLGVQNDLIRAVAAVNPKTIVVLNNGGPVLVSDWIDRVPAAIEAFFPGQAGGTALAKILFGDVNPSGKLTYTIGKAREDYPDFRHYPINPGTFDLAKGFRDGVVDYQEGIYVGYRHFDKKAVEPSFPFGHGLSYTTFRYGNVKLSTPRFGPDGRVTVTADITNTGTRAGAEVVQLYVRDTAPKIDRPIRELKGFARVELKPGETKPVRFEISPRDLAYCDVPGKAWKADAGVYSLELGASSRDLRAKASLALTSDYTLPVPGMGAVSPYAPVTSLTTGKIATASSVQDSLTPDKAIDGSRDSRWSSQPADPQWLAVDLEKPVRFDRAIIRWEAAYAQSYQLQTSEDGKNWTTVYTQNNGQGGKDSFSFPPVTARWVRIYGTQRGTGFGYSIFDFGLFGPK